MRIPTRTWYLLSILLFVAAVWFWLEGDRRMGQKRLAVPAVEVPGRLPALQSRPAATPSAAGSAASAVSGSKRPAWQLGGAASAGAPAGIAPDPRTPHRLRNTDRSWDALGQTDTVLLLENAILDTAVDEFIDIPEHLRAGDDPGAYVIQSTAGLTPAFYDLVEAAGASVVSYVPHNALLVRADRNTAERLLGDSRVRALARYEPYYKLAPDLVATALEQGALEPLHHLNLICYAGSAGAVRGAVEELGGLVIAEDRTPFGPQLTVRPAPDSLVRLARLPDVQRVETATPRVLVNDLTRTRVRVSIDTLVSTNYLGLTGTNLTVNLNDSGVDASHPDLAGRVTTTDTNAFTLVDFNGHGTHVAGTIASAGGLSPVGAEGSETNASFRGMAPAASLFVLPIDLRTGPLISDLYLQETAAQNNYVTLARTNAPVSNNSWGYLNAFAYTASAASFDAAVRDARPEVPGPQPIIYVFAAGNSGSGTTNGTAGRPDSVLAPATAKNVISVGAIESPRGFTNEAFAGFTDSDNEVAAFSSRGNTGVGSEGDYGRFKPDVVAPGVFTVSTRSQNMVFEDPTFPSLGQYYRYESGTSMAAPAVSGVLVLMQEFLEQRLRVGYSPALLKALLINGARSVNANYDFQVRGAANFQGWGLVNLTNSLPAVLASGTNQLEWPVRFFDQSPTNVLTTGRKHTWNLTVNSNALFEPLRVTLVWTDPPGNPGTAIKLVNDLDLVVTNLVTGDVYRGNDFRQGKVFTDPTLTNEVALVDFVNNVENIFLEGPLSTNYSITVVGRRVNVNAVTADYTGIAQDYALVISAGNGELTRPFELRRQAPAAEPGPEVVNLTNGVPRLRERVGANFQLASTPNGTPDQWRFYVFTNAYFTNGAAGLTNGSNVAFVTFIPPNLSRTRNLDADIDLFVSRDPRLTNLNAGVVAASLQSRNRGGTELVVLTNAPVGPDVVFYIGVKSEDQQGAEYGIAAFSSEQAFDEQDAEGNHILRGVPPFAEIPDGSPPQPGFVPMFAFGVFDYPVARVIVTNHLVHQSVGDLLGNLSHESQFAVLNNHNRYAGEEGAFFYPLTYDDSGAGDFFYSRRTDGPGSLNNFLGTRGSGVWLLTMTDDSLGRTGRVSAFNLYVQPQQALDGTLEQSIQANQWRYYFIDVPADATNLTVLLSQMSGPLDLYIRRDELPTFDAYDKSALINPPGGALSIGLNDVPPLSEGRYYIGVFNPTAQVITYRISAVIGRGLRDLGAQAYASSNPPPSLLDDAVSRSFLVVTNNRPVTSVEVGVRIDHQRASDLVLHLVNPQGERVLLAENRGGANLAGYGLTASITNFLSATNSGGAAEKRTTYNVGTNQGTLLIDYEFFFATADTLRVYYDGNRIFDSGPTFGSGTFSVPFGPGISTSITIVMNEGGNLPTTWNYRAYLLTQPRIVYTQFTDQTNRTTTPIKFGVAPFATATGLATNLLWTNGFDAAAAGTYRAVTNVDAWTVVSNQVRVSTVRAHTPSNGLFLRDGTIATVLPTTAGRRYLLNHVFAADPNDPDLLAWWQFQGDLTDVVRSNRLTAFNGVTNDNAFVGLGIGLDGVDDYATAPTNAAWRDGSLTLDAWIRPGHLTNAMPVLEFSDTNGLGNYLMVNADPSFAPGALAGRIVTASGSAVVASLPGLLRPLEWQHVALTYNELSGSVVLYLNGLEVARTNLPPAPTSQPYPLQVGRRPAGLPDPHAGTFYAGMIDEVGIYTRALGASELRALYLAAESGRCGAQTLDHPRPVAWWPGEGNADDYIGGADGTGTGVIGFGLGTVGNALAFFGTGEVVVPDAPVLSPARLTIEGWVYPTQFDGEVDTLVSKELSGALLPGYLLGVRGTNDPGVGTIPAGNLAFQLGGVTGLPDDYQGWVDGGVGLLPNQWAHVALTFDGGTARVFVNGVLARAYTGLGGALAVNAGPLKIGSRADAVVAALPGERFDGLVDELSLYDRALPEADIRAIHEAGGRGKYSLTVHPGPCPVGAEVWLDGAVAATLVVTNESPGLFRWRTNTLDFTARANGTPLALVAREPEMWFDSFELREIVGTSSYYLPEEPLKPLLAQPALGQWTLEVWDNRTGGSARPPTIISWQLILNFARTNPPAPVLTNCTPDSTVFGLYTTNCVEATNVVSGDEIKYFIVEVPRRATLATNLLSGTGDLVLLFNHDGLPDGTLPGDVIVDAFGANAGEILILNTNTPPELRPGQRYYLGVANFNPNETNSFTLRVLFDQIDTNLVNPITLTNGIGYAATVPPGATIDYYQYVVSTNAGSVAFEVFPQNGNVDLIVRKALPIPDPLPRPNPGLHDYLSDNPTNRAEQIVVTPNSQPVPLAPGVWYLGVYNVDNAPVNYTVRATEFTNSTVTVIPLLNAVPVPYALAPDSAFTNFFLFSITQNDPALLFEVYNLNGDARLVADVGVFPTPGIFFSAADGSPSIPAQIVLRTNDTLPSLNGDWYLAVDNLQNTNLAFSIRAVVATNGILPSGVPLAVGITPAPPPGTGLIFNWNSVIGETYMIQATADLTQPITWTTLATIVATDVTTSWQDPDPLTQPFLFYRIIQVPAAGP